MSNNEGFIDVQYGTGLLVILGAGASFDSLPNPYVDMPPLTDGLAASTLISNNVLARFPRARPVISELRSRLEALHEPSEHDRTLSLEQTLREYQKKSLTNVDIPKQLTAFRFYLRDLLYETALGVRGVNGGINNYTRLVAKCYQWALDNNRIVCFVNFNYDPLLEWACQEQFGFKIGDPDSFTHGKVVYVVKPHGSVFWGWQDLRSGPIGLPDPAEVTIERGEPDAESNLSLHIKAGPFDYVGESSLTYATYPALALPIESDKKFVWPEDQHALFAERFTNGTFGKILTIGWRGMEPHFIELLPRLVSSMATLWTVNGGNQSDVYETVKNLNSIVYPTTGLVGLTTGFSEFVNSDMIDGLLST